MPQTIFPALRYRDAPAAIEWLERAFGCTRLQVHEGPDGSVAHAELRLGDGVIMLSSDRDDAWGLRAGRGWLYVVVADPDALHARATAAGAAVVMGLTDTDYGSRDFSVKDLEGNDWSFGTYAPATGEGGTA